MRTKVQNDDCVLRTFRGCAALKTVQPDCGPKCPFYKNKEMEIMSRDRAVTRCKERGYTFESRLPVGWDE